MALSTSMPTPRARPPRDMTFKVVPVRYMRKKVATTESGIEMPMISVERRSFRKRRRMRTAIAPPIRAFDCTWRIDARMKLDWSAPAPTSTPSGSSARIRSRRSETARATCTVLASPSL